MAKKGLILITDEKSGRIVAVRVTSLRRVAYEFERLIDHFDIGATEEPVMLVPIAQTFAIRLKRMTPVSKIHTDHGVTLSLSPSSQPLS